MLKIAQVVRKFRCFCLSSPSINQVNHTPDKRGPCPNVNTYAVTNPDYFSKTVTDTSHAEDWD
ncbi:hypothetical protein MGG_18109 [Pyricularia oryzae 70-15]|uniref:Uncharacterized protein n=3 Tax=Pyricularia oryzae TaxID=318829 RepID=Q2KEV0_PYRO7|nr:uncharacterized protein MGG_18109 [Pyricularia oryzae 70-15]EAQ71529.1 hypothetical protein MGCH7_ch7g936 [Pyricularia oryzae 70-15]ELQ35288.1 hypothetical protein OOU_Y34scaffold00718g3 [Pyricularia oryzae Y34]KYQ30464.1 hypothetical protein MGG_18109 [Pyricularia oryzae 70-15]